MWRAALAEAWRQRREEPVNGRRRNVRGQQLMELVVERPRPLHDRDVLRDPRQTALRLRIFEPPRKRLREVRDVGAEHRNHAPAEDRVDHGAQMVVRRRAANSKLETDVLPENRAVELLELRPWLDAELIYQPASRVLVDLERLGLPP